MLKKTIWEYPLVIAAGVLYGIALKYFVLPSKVILTGFEGIASALSYFFENYTLFIILYAVFQIALLTFGFIKVSRIFAWRSFIVILTVLLVLAIFPDFRFAQPEPQNERIILVLFGGILAGFAKALAFKNKGSTGDEDIIAAFFAVKLLKPVGSIAVIAGIVSTIFGLSLELIKNGSFESVVNTLMYTCIYIFASTETLNTLYKKFKITMLVIITTCHEKIGEAILRISPHRTYTLQSGIGGKTGESYSMVRTMITHEELDQVIEAVEETDPQSFYYFHDIEGTSRKYYISPIGS